MYRGVLLMSAPGIRTQTNPHPPSASMLIDLDFVSAASPCACFPGLVGGLDTVAQRGLPAATNRHSQARAVIPAKAGIHAPAMDSARDSRFRGNDGLPDSRRRRENAC